MGASAEKLTPYTLSGLALVTLGFVSYLYFARRRSSAARRVKALSVASAGDIEADLDGTAEPWGFHDRVVGVQATHTTDSSLTKALLSGNKNA